MIPDPSERASRRKPDPLDAELDALVAREVDALSARKARPGVTRRVADAKADPDAGARSAGPHPTTQAPRVLRAPMCRRAQRKSGRTTTTSSASGARCATGKPTASCSRRRKRPSSSSPWPFSKRENADLIIEEIWTQSVLDRHDNLDDASPDETLSPEQVDEIGPDALPGAPSSRPNGSGAGRPPPTPSRRSSPAAAPVQARVSPTLARRAE